MTHGEGHDEVSDEASIIESVENCINGTEDAKDEEEFLFGMDDDDDVAMGEQREPQLAEPFVIHPEGDQREPRDLQSPIKPSARAVELHSYTHIPYRSWCKICKAARCREDGHGRVKASDDDAVEGNAMPIISLDYQELNEDADKL